MVHSSETLRCIYLKDTYRVSKLFQRHLQTPSSVLCGKNISLTLQYIVQCMRLCIPCEVGNKKNMNYSTCGTELIDSEPQ